MSMNNTQLHNLLMDLATNVTDLKQANQDLTKAEALAQALQGLADEVGQHRQLSPLPLNTGVTGA